MSAYWPFASFRCDAAIRPESGESRHAKNTVQSTRMTLSGPYDQRRNAALCQVYGGIGQLSLEELIAGLFVQLPSNPRASPHSGGGNAAGNATDR